MSQKTAIKKLLQNATEVYYKVCQELQSASGIIKCDRSLLQSEPSITKCVTYCKVLQVLQSVIETAITKYVRYYKV